MDAFALFGFPHTYALDLAEVERRYLAASRELHPDYHGSASPAQQLASLKETAKLNEAYLILTDPFRRLEHLLTLAGGPTATEEKSLDQAFLMEMMDLRERLEAGEPLQDDIEKRRRELLDAAGALFGEKADLKKIRQMLNAAKTLASLTRQPGV